MELNAIDVKSRTPLWLAACQDGKQEFIQKLLEANADINYADAEEKRTPIQVFLGKII